MKRVFRIIIMIAVLFGIVGLARNQVAWAANSSEKTNQSSALQIGKSLAPGQDDDCDKAENKDRDRCKDKDKDKCKKHPEKCGSVKPPAQHIVIQKTGDYSVGGFCTLSVTLNDPAVNLDAHIETPLPGELPDKVQRVRQACHLTYSSSNQRIDALPVNSGNTTICFAVIPGKPMTLYFYNIYSLSPAWTSLETTVENGRACAIGNASGVYVASFQQP